MASEVLIDEKESKQIAREYKELLKVSYRSLSASDKKLIRQAFDLAVDAHKDQRRMSGEAYIFHPIAVAKIIASEIGLDAASIATALLHDVVEDTSYTHKDIERLFGKTIARIVEGLTKIDALELEQQNKDISLQAENFRKMLLTLNEDVRVIIIKIADRLHNMQTMAAMRRDKQVKIASETLYIYAPLAHRIGLYNIKTELEDLGLKYTDPDVYNDILKKIKESKEDQDAYIRSFNDILKVSLDREKIKYEIKGRPKSIYSIHRKMVTKNIHFEEVYDKFAVRIIYEADEKSEKFLAWKIYSIVTDHFRPNPTRLRDWISSPKSTGYEALHITVVGPKGRWVEVQIRSQRMNEIAEKGYAAHYRYKTKENKEDQGLDAWLNRLQETLENPEVNAIDFVEQFKLNLYAEEIFVFTPQGDLISLPKGATALDFAFAIHTEVGLQTRGARVNNRLRPLGTELKSGDQVEIITSESVKPSSNWIDYTTTGKARSKIRWALRQEKNRIADEGKIVLGRKLKSLKLSLNEKTVNALVRYFKLQTSLDLFYRVGNGNIDNTMLREFAASRSGVMGFFRQRIRKDTEVKGIHKPEITDKYDQLVFGKEEERLEYTMANCCNPIPGDDVFGFVTVKDGIKVHKNSCPNALQLQSHYTYRILPAKWIDSTQQGFSAKLHVTGLDNLGLVSEVTKVISGAMNINMKRIKFDSNGGVFDGSIIVVVKNKTILNEIMAQLKKIEGVDKVTRE